MTHYGKVPKSLSQRLFTHLSVSAGVVTAFISNRWNTPSWTKKIEELSRFLATEPAKRTEEMDTTKKRVGLRGLTLASMRKYPAIIPLVLLMASGTSLGLVYMMRVAIKHPEVSWRRKSNPEPWHEYANKRYKLIVLDEKPYSEGCPAPNYKTTE